MGSWRRVSWGLVLITRPGNVALTALSVGIGGVCAGAVFGDRLVWAGVSAALVSAGGYVVNDVFDLEIDRVNKPDRPLPHGDLNVAVAVGWTVPLILSGLVLAWMLGVATGAVATAIVVGLVVYAAFLKRTLLVGHFSIAVMSGAAFYYGGLTGPRSYAALVPAVLAGCFHLGREMLKASADWRGDMAGGADTIAVRWGPAMACRLSVIPLACVVALSPFPTVWGWFGVPYLIIVIFGVDSVLLYAIGIAWTSPGPVTAGRLAMILKWDMVAGLAAVGGDRWMA